MEQAEEVLMSHLNKMLTLKRSIKDSEEGEFPFQYYGMEDYLLKNATMYKNQELTEEESEIVRKAIINTPSDFNFKECYYNSQLLVISDKYNSLTYVEGVCQTTFFPFSHAWVELNGKVIDTTIRDPMTSDGKMTLGVYKDRAYFGCKFPRLIVKERVFVLKEGGSFLDDWPGKYPLYTGEIVIDHNSVTVVKGGYKSPPKKEKKRRGSK